MHDCSRLGVALAALVGCTHPSVNPTPPVEPAPELIAEAEPAPTQPAATPSMAPEDAFFAVYEALRDGDWLAFERFAGADRLRFVRVASLAENQAPEVQVIPCDQVHAWLVAVEQTWAPSCMDAPEGPCRGLNPLSLGLDREQIELRCAGPEPSEFGSLCCRHQPALLHNTPFLAAVCFDEAQQVTQVTVIDG